MCWSKKSNIVLYSEEYAQTDSFLLLLYEHGPLAIVRLFGSNGLTGYLNSKNIFKKYFT